MVGGVLFDFNGTMIFDAPVVRQAWEEFLEPLIGRLPTEEEFRQHIQGVTNTATMSYFATQVPAERRDAWAALDPDGADVVYRRLIASSPACRLVDGLPELLDELARRGVPVNIATSAPVANVDLFFERLPLARWFDRGRVALADGSMPGKPAPDVYLLAARDVGVDAARCAVFEDAPNGLEAARRAGSPCVVALTSTLSPDEALALPGTAAAIADYRDLDGIMALLESR